MSYINCILQFRNMGRLSKTSYSLLIYTQFMWKKIKKGVDPIITTVSASACHDKRRSISIWRQWFNLHSQNVMISISVIHIPLQRFCFICAYCDISARHILSAFCINKNICTKQVTPALNLHFGTYSWHFFPVYITVRYFYSLEM